MNALITIDQPQPQAEHARPGPEPILTPALQGAFLASLQLVGNVSIACAHAKIARMTAYRARRRSAAFARAWDAALLAARVHAEAELADRAINGVEEAVFYHGEEVARRRRYDSRLLLAHLARLDKMAERADLQADQARLDDWVDALERGEDLAAVIAAEDADAVSSQDTVTGVTGSASGGAGAAPPCHEAEALCGRCQQRPVCEDSDFGLCEACDLDERVHCMDCERPLDTPFWPYELAKSPEEERAITMKQLAAFEQERQQWFTAHLWDDEDTPWEAEEDSAAEPIREAEGLVADAGCGPSPSGR